MCCFYGTFSKDKALTALNAGKVVFFAGGIGHPIFFNGYGNRCLRAIEIEADMILSARAIDGVYDSDPKLNKDAKKYDTIPIKEVVG